MSNIRTIFDNPIERAALSSPDTAGSLIPANLQSGRKSRVWRSAGTAATLAAAFATPEPIRAVIWPFVNWSDAAQMRVRVSTENAATNLAKGSQTLSNAHGWSGASVIASAVQFKGALPFVEVKKTATTANESRSIGFGAVAANSTYTYTIALRAAGSTAVGLGLYDGAAWGASADSSASIMEGPGVLTRSNGALWGITGLSSTTDTVVRITRTYLAAGTGSALIYPGGASSTTISHSVLATRVQVESGSESTSYYPTTTAAATRPAGHIDSWQSYQYDSGMVLACPAPGPKLRGFTPAQAAGAYANGGGNYSWHWLPSEIQARGLSVYISDPANLQGYIEAAFLVAGPYWEASYNPIAAPMGYKDSTALTYSRAGDQLADTGVTRRKLDIELSCMDAVDRAPMESILRNSRAYPILVSVFPDHADAAVTKAYMVYGRRMQDSDISPDVALTYSMSIPLEEV